MSLERDFAKHSKLSKSSNEDTENKFNLVAISSSLNKSSFFPTIILFVSLSKAKTYRGYSLDIPKPFLWPIV